MGYFCCLNYTLVSADTAIKKAKTSGRGELSISTDDNLTIGKAKNY